MREHPLRVLIVSLAAVITAAVVARLFFSVQSTDPQDQDRQAISEAVSGSRAPDLSSGKFNDQVATRPLSTAATAPEDDRLLETLRTRLEKPNVAPHEALLSFLNPEALDRFVRQAASRGLVTLSVIPQLNTARVRYTTLEGLRDAMAANGAGYAGVEGNLWLQIPQPPPQPDGNNQGGAAPFGQNMMSAINASGDRTHWGDAVTVAVLDTGVQAHPTFAANQVTHLDLINDGQAFNSHGTSVASLIGGQDPQAPGVAPGAKILDIRIANADGATVGSILAQGIITATDQGAQVINISFGAYGESAVLAQALDYAFQRGAVVVASAGNDAYDQLAIPAAYDRVISVGSVDAKGQQAYFSNSGDGLDLVAPGVGVITAWKTDKIALVSGTSQSSAIVAGAAAAYLGWGVSSGDLAARLKADARPTGSPASQVGAGILKITAPAGR